MFQSKRKLVLVTRDMAEKISLLVFPHEVPLLKELHGEENVIELKPADDDYEAMAATAKIEVLDPQEEFNRLSLKYGNHPDIKQLLVEVVYGRWSEFAYQRAWAQMSPATDEEVDLSGDEMPENVDDEMPPLIRDEKIRREYASGNFTQRQLARQYGMQQSQISTIVNRA